METGYNLSDYDPASLSLNRTMQYGNSGRGTQKFLSLDKFKSYYVVWKRVRVTNNSGTPVSLNRTMQYGNTLIAGAGESFMVV